MIVPVTEQHIEELARTMQQADVDSIKAMSGLSAEEGLRRSIANAVETQAYIVDGRVAAINGIGSKSLLADHQPAWMLGSDLIVKHPRLVLNLSKEWVNEKVEQYGWFRNYVDARHTRSIKWLKWLGFTIYPAEPFGIYNMPFHMNELKRK